MHAHGRNTSHVACDCYSTSEVTLKNLDKKTTWIHEELIVATKSKAQRIVYIFMNYIVYGLCYLLVWYKTGIPGWRTY